MIFDFSKLWLKPNFQLKPMKDNYCKRALINKTIIIEYDYLITLFLTLSRLFKILNNTWNIFHIHIVIKQFQLNKQGIVLFFIYL